MPGAAPIAPPKKKSGCLKFVLIGLGLFVLFCVIVALLDDGERPPSGKPVDPAVTLEQAESNIVSDLSGVAYSNSEEGKKLAENFGALFKKAALEGTDAIKDRHEFITHCQLNENSALFLVHVPKLRKFDDESKERFCEIAWVIAHAVLADAEFPEGAKLAVGVKGIALYQNIYFGNYSAANPLKEAEGVVSKSTETSALEEFFEAVPTAPSE